MADSGLTVKEVAGFLATVHADAAVSGVEPLQGGFWSSAFGYRAGDTELVVRFGSVPDGYEMDRRAMAFSGPDLPVPHLYEIGQGLGRTYAISSRHHGRYLETIRPDETAVASATVVRLLDALRLVPQDADTPVDWKLGPSARNWSWARSLTEALRDDPAQPVSGWRKTLAADPSLDRLYVAYERRIRELAPVCPDLRHVVHGDLLHGNVLISEDGSEVTAVFSWKCSHRGDFLYDTAWCTFWGSVLYPGIAAATVDVLPAVLERAAADGDPGAIVDAHARHHCYELQIAARHLGWYAWVDDDLHLRAVPAGRAAAGRVNLDLTASGPDP